MLEAIEEGRDELVDLATSLVRFDTTARIGDEPARDEAALQAFLAARLEEVGAEVELWEPGPSDVEPHPQVPPGLTFEGRPQLVARLPGDQRRRTLLFNGHIDAVPADPIESWTIHPFEPEVKDGCLYGRGTCDMKGGVAAMVFAVETLRHLGVTLSADLLINTVTDEESCGAGTLASLAHGLEADAAIVPEPTNLSVVVACRGILNLTVTVRGRPGHATMYQPDWREGGAVNAIEKAAVVMSALRSLEEDWARRPSLHHPHLPAPTIVPTLIKGGEWKVSYPANCAVFFDIAYMPAQINSSGAGSTVRTEIAERIAAASNRDGWLAAHPPELEWGLDMPPGEVNSAGGTIVDCVRAAAQVANGAAAIGGLDSWHDAASLIRVGRIPTVDFGPANVSADGRSLMHAIDEHVPVDDLVATAKTLALAAMRFE